MRYTNTVPSPKEVNRQLKAIKRAAEKIFADPKKTQAFLEKIDPDFKKRKNKIKK